MNFYIYKFNIGEIALAEKFCEDNQITFISYNAYLADFQYFNDYMLNQLDYHALSDASKELMLGICDDFMEKYDETMYVSKNLLLCQMKN